MKLYIHHSSCISPQNTFEVSQLDELITHNDIMVAKEPQYEDIPKRELRRMGKVVRMGLGTALSIVKSAGDVDGVIIGTGNGGMENCVKFFQQIIEYEEGVLTPGNFVQSSSNTIASTIALMSSNKGYNNTHVNEGQAFESALIDCQLQLADNPTHKYLVGGLDDVATYNNNIDNLGGWNRMSPISNVSMFEKELEGALPGEGASMFLMSSDKEGAKSSINLCESWNGEDLDACKLKFDALVKRLEKEGGFPDLLIDGQNGDCREDAYYKIFENSFKNIFSLKFKQLCGEYPSASGIGLWLANFVLEHQTIPKFWFGGQKVNKEIKNIVIYNCYHKNQHSLIHISLPK